VRRITASVLTPAASLMLLREVFFGGCEGDALGGGSLGVGAGARRAAFAATAGAAAAATFALVFGLAAAATAGLAALGLAETFSGAGLVAAATGLAAAATGLVAAGLAAAAAGLALLALTPFDFAPFDLDGLADAALLLAAFVTRGAAALAAAFFSTMPEGRTAPLAFLGVTAGERAG
jgi:hypothetical protein